MHRGTEKKNFFKIDIRWTPGSRFRAGQLVSIIVVPHLYLAGLYMLNPTEMMDTGAEAASRNFVDLCFLASLVLLLFPTSSLNGLSGFHFLGAASSDSDFALLPK